MPPPIAEAAVEDLTRSHRELLRLVDSLSEKDWERPVPYGEWTVKDLVAHVTGDMSPGWAGLILAGVLTPQFIVEMGKGYDARTANAAAHAVPVENNRTVVRAVHDAPLANPSLDRPFCQA